MRRSNPSSCCEKKEWIASRSLSSGAHSRDPLARNDGWQKQRRQALLPLEVGGLDDRPPAFRLGLLERTQGFRRLLRQRAV
jgi:hypothetical protein